MAKTKKDPIDRFLRAYARAAIVLAPHHLSEWDSRGLTMPQLRILFMLTVKDGATPGYLAERMRVTPSTITGLTDRLVRQDFIRRDEDPKDRRLVRLHITESGKAVSSELEAVSKAHLRGILARMTEEQVAKLTELMEEFWMAAEAAESAKGPA